jgi:hypothetical protein
MKCNCGAAVSPLLRVCSRCFQALWAAFWATMDDATGVPGK